MSEKIEKFEDLKIWKEGMLLTIKLYNQLAGCKYFGLCDQIKRASVSISSNIAEGFERNTNKDFIRFLYISKSSAGELRTQLYLCRELGLIPKKECNELIEHTRKISAMIYNFIKTRYNNFT